MNKFKKLTCALALVGLSSVANVANAEVSLSFAKDIQVDLGSLTLANPIPAGESWDTCAGINGTSALCGALTNDGDDIAGLFDAFTFSGFLATSIYDLSSGALDTFIDTNDRATLTGLGITDVSGTDFTAADTVSTVSLRHPSVGDSVIDELLGTQIPGNDNENYGLNESAFGGTWWFDTVFTVEGAIVGALPDYSGGSFDLVYKDVWGNSELVLSTEFVNDSVALNGLNAAVVLDFDVTFAKAGFFSLVGNGGSTTALESVISGPNDIMSVSFDVAPAVPSLSTLGMVSATQGVRQADMAGRAILPIPVPEPTSIALFGLGLLGLAGASRRKTK